MNLLIKSLSLHNFKGITDLTLSFNGQDANISGDNGTGKTTIMDAWLWLLFGKDSQNRTTFSVKPQDANGNDIHHLETTVTAVLLLDGAETTISKTYAEVWTKKRGTSTSELTNHTSDFLIDGVPKKAGEFKAWVANLCEESLFRLLSNPLHFNSAVKWDERRKVLFSLVDDVSEDEIIDKDMRYKAIAHLLSSHSVDDARKAVKYQIAQLKKLRESIPPRIDELTRSIGDADPAAVSGAVSSIKEYQRQLAEIDTQIHDANAAGQRVSVAYARIAELEAQITRREREASDGANKMRLDGLRELAVLRRELDLARAEQQRQLNMNLASVGQAEKATQEAAALRSEWGTVNAAVFEEPEIGCCPVCKQSLPESMATAQTDDLRKSWLRDKQAKLDDITRRGKAASSNAAYHTSEAEKSLVEHKRLEGVVQQNEADIAALTHLETMAEAVAEINIIEEQSEIAKLRAQIAAAISTDTTALREQNRALQAQIQTAQQVVSRGEAAEKARERISELSDQERNVGEQIAALEGNEFLLEELESERCNLLEERINALFTTVRWRLFDRQINGGISPTCEALVNGVPYPDANNAAKINAGLEIIDRLCSHYGVSVPVFIDNRESVNNLYRGNSQTVSLIVSHDPKLRIELENMKEAA